MYMYSSAKVHRMLADSKKERTIKVSERRYSEGN